MSLHQILAEQRRRSLLEALAEDPEHIGNERVLRQYLTARVSDVDRDQLRADLAWLEQAGLLRVEKLEAGEAGVLWRARLLDRGLAVAKGRQHPGVADVDLG